MYGVGQGKPDKRNKIVLNVTLRFLVFLELSFNVTVHFHLHWACIWALSATVAMELCKFLSEKHCYVMGKIIYACV